MSEKQSFTAFKADFYSKIKDFTLFDCAEFNALKIVLDGLRVNYVSRGPVKSPIFGSLLAYEVENKLKSIRAKVNKSPQYSKKDFQRFEHTSYLISDDGRIAIDAQGVPHSYYFTALMKALSAEHCLHIIEKKRHDKAQAHLNYEILINTFLHQKLNKDEKKLIAEIRTTFNRISSIGIFNDKELKNIAFAFQNFFNKYKVWSRLLTHCNPKTMFCIVHYHNEGKTLAFRRKGIKVIELQHGLIATKDVFYVFPKPTASIIRRALFADEIWVYGNYWKQVLEQGVEYANNIKVAGYYLYDDFKGYEAIEKEIDEFAQGNHLIIITTQTSLHQAFIDYTMWLVHDIKQRKLPYKILVKTHPLEKQEHYKPLHQEELIKMANHPLPVLFKKVQLHVTIYSTTLYDGARAGVPGFALHNEQYKDYIEEIISSGVAFPLAQHQNPVDLISQLKKVDPHYYYSEFKTDQLLLSI